MGNNLCVRKVTSKRHICCGFDGAPTGRKDYIMAKLRHSSRHEEYIREFELLVGAGGRILPRSWMKSDVHFRLQSKVIEEDCGVGVGRLNYLGVLTQDRKLSNYLVKTMLYILFKGGGRGVNKLVDRYFPISGHATKTAKWHSTGAHESQHEFYRKRESLESVLRYVEPDYIKFRRPLPQWAIR